VTDPAQSGPSPLIMHGSGRVHPDGKEVAMRTEVSIGVPGALGPEAVRVLAPRIEAAGFAGLWLNDGSGGDPLVGLAAAAEVTTHLRLSTGVAPVDRRPAPDLLRDLRASGVPEARLTLGIGSGQLRRGAVEAVAAAVAALRDETSAAIMVGALGPRMRRMAAEHADGALLSWLPPDVAAQQSEELREAGRQAQNELPRVALYARTIVDEAARPVLERESAQYASYPAYAANFERLGVAAIDTTLPRAGSELAAGVAAYSAVDELVLRAITRTGSLDDLLAFVDRAAELLAEPGRIVG
jgi:alkanesulfonate monooxygenase SsuD/methylene tetrahydromethanopterin reductase-like flavin-dependent oxidoreductase (luciferase family)